MHSYTLHLLIYTLYINCFAKGPNDVWHLDGYDKLKPYGFSIHGCIDGYVNWLNIDYKMNKHNIILSE